MFLHSEQDEAHLRLFFEYGIAFNGPTSYEAQSNWPVPLRRQTAEAAESAVKVLVSVLARHFHAWPVPHFPLRDQILAPPGPGKRPASPFFAGRFDLLLDSTDTLRVIELNADRNGLQRESMAHPTLGSAFRRRFLSVLLKYWQQHGHAPKQRPRVAVVIAPAYREESSLAPFYALTIQEGLGWPAVVAGVDNLTVDRSGRVRAFGQQVDLILRHYPTEYLHELICGLELVASHRQGRVLILNDPASIRLQAKNWMAVLSHWLRDPASPLTPDERAVLGPLLPFTASLTSPELPADPADPHSPAAPLRSALLAHPERWVLKPALGRYSWGVAAGALVSAQEWREAVRFALARPEQWVAQQAIPQQPILLCRWHKGQEQQASGYVTFGLHLLDGEIADWCARCSLSAITDDAWFAPVTLVP